MIDNPGLGRSGSGRRVRASPIRFRTFMNLRSAAGSPTAGTSRNRAVRSGRRSVRGFFPSHGLTTISGSCGSSRSNRRSQQSAWSGSSGSGGNTTREQESSRRISGRRRGSRGRRGVNRSVSLSQGHIGHLRGYCKDYTNTSCAVKKLEK